MNKILYVAGVSLLAAAFSGQATIVSAATPLKIMPLGDSITDGVGGSGGYRAPLYTDLTTANYQPFQFVGSLTDNPGSLPTTPVDQTHHEGHSGFTVGGIAAVRNGWIASANPDVILLHIGTNNFGGDGTASQNAASALAVEMQLDSLVNQIYTDKPGVKLYVAGIIPKLGSNGQVSDYNSDISTLLVPKYAALGDSITYVDQYHNFVDGNGNQITSLYADGTVHPNNAGYQLMANTWAAALQAPEPSSIALIGAGSLSLLARRRRI